jgi:methanogenic corrinoid protein MtbC1
MNASITYKIGEISRLSGIPIMTLRNWEKRLGFPKPDRSSGQQRRYTDLDLKALQSVARLHREGVAPRLLAEAFFAEKETLQKSPSHRGYQNETSHHEQALLNKLSRALTQFRGQDAGDIINTFALTMRPLEVLETVYLPLLRRVGTQWERGEINVAQEHYASQFIRSKILNFTENITQRYTSKTVVLATLEGERHEGGLLALNAILKISGFQTVYLGTNIPLADFEESLKEIRPTLIGLSFSNPAIFTQNKSHLLKYSRKVIVGGEGVPIDKRFVAPLERASGSLSEIAELFVARSKHFAQK